MKHPFLTILFLLIATFHSHAQSTSLTDEQWLPLYQALETEDWATAEKLASNYLDQVKPEDDNNTLGRLRFMYLFSAAGRIAAGKMTFDDLHKRAEAMVGKEIVFPGRFAKATCQDGVVFNALCKTDNYDIKVTSTNGAGTIFSYEYIKLREKFDWVKNDGKVVSISGTIDSIAPNPDKPKLLIMRIYVSDGRVKVKEEPVK